MRRHPPVPQNDGVGATLDDVIRCARPIHFELADDEVRYAGNGSAFLAVDDQTWMLFTAAHVVGAVDSSSIRVLPTDESRRWLLFRRRVRTRSLLQNDTDLADVACFTIDVGDLDLRSGDSLAGIDLRFPTARPVAGDRLLITGYPAASRSVDYDGRGIVAIGRGLWASYVGAGIAARCHEIELIDVGDLSDIDGFSGSAVYRVGEMEGGLATVQLAGMVLRGSASARRAHYVEASVLVAMAETAVTGRVTHLARPAGGEVRET